MLATSSHKGDPIDQAMLTGAVAIFIGNEGAGLPREVMAQMDGLITIPQSEKVESLNAGVAASILMYEAARQRRS
jgi:TrmH family RNA methyltransferase